MSKGVEGHWLRGWDSGLVGLVLGLEQESAWRVWRGGLVVGCTFVAEVDVGWFGVSVGGGEGGLRCWRGRCAD